MKLFFPLIVKFCQPVTQFHLPTTFVKSLRIENFNISAVAFLFIPVIFFEMALNNTKAIKVGNWLEELVLEEQTGVKFYPNPRDKKNSLMTKSRCITHSDQVQAKDYQSTVQSTMLQPQQHPDFILHQSIKKGPRQQLIESRLKAQVEADFKRASDQDTAEKNKVLYASVNNETFQRKGFTPSLIVGDSSIRMQTKNADYASENALTYYSSKIASKDASVNFPTTFSSSIRNPFQRSSAFSADIKDPLSRIAETNERVSKATNPRDIRALNDVRERLIRVVRTDDTSPGGAVRYLLSLIMTVADINGSDYVPIEALEQSLAQNLSFELNSSERAAIQVSYNVDISGKVSLPGFANLIRGRMSPRRIELVNIAFFSIDRQGDGSGKLSEDLIRCSFFPSPSSGTLDSLVDGLGFQYVETGLITFDEFIDYYASVSAEVLDNEKFEQLIRTSWGL